MLFLIVNIMHVFPLIQLQLTGNYATLLNFDTTEEENVCVFMIKLNKTISN